jgi:hypothetical protein
MSDQIQPELAWPLQSRPLTTWVDFEWALGPFGRVDPPLGRACAAGRFLSWALTDAEPRTLRLIQKLAPSENVRPLVDNLVGGAAAIPDGSRGVKHREVTHRG